MKRAVLSRIFSLITLALASAQSNFCPTCSGFTGAPFGSGYSMAAERAPPAVTITSPATSPVNDTITLTAACTDTVLPLPCTQVVFAIDGTTVVADTTSPYTTTFDTRLLLDAKNPHTLTATGTNTGGVSATATSSFNTNNGTIAPQTFYIATNGNDSNAGTSDSPWKTPKHNLRCGDTINLKAGTYPPNNFDSGQWGKVWSCPTAAGLYFAKLICNSAFVQDCLITNNTAGKSIMVVSANNWAVHGVTAQNSVQYGGCFLSQATYVAFINVYAKFCGAGSGGSDYSAYIGMLAYGGGGKGGQCFSNLSIYQPKDTNPADTGTRVFIAGSFFINATNAASCTDGEGVIFDRWDENKYKGTGVIEQSLFLGNCSEAWEVNNGIGGSTGVMVHSTTWGNGLTCGGGSGGGQEIYLQSTSMTIIYDSNISVGTVASVPIMGSGTVPFYTIRNSFDTHVTLSNSYVWNTTGARYTINTNNINPMTQINITNADPGFAAPAQVTAAPDCSTSATAFACMEAIRANFVPSGGAASLGYQPPGACAPDPLYPVWLKGAVPDGLLTKPCGY